MSLRARYPDELPAVAIGDLYRSREPLDPFEFEWPMDSVTAVYITLHPFNDHVRLGCSFVATGRTRERKEALVAVVFQEGPRGGARAYFVCPRCGARRTQLFVHPYDLEPICRVCAGISYESQRRSSDDRKLARAQRIRLELGGAAENFGPLPSRPYGMHRSTYERRIATVTELEAAARHLRVKRFVSRERSRGAAWPTSERSRDAAWPTELKLDARHEHVDVLREFLAAFEERRAARSQE